MDLELSKKIAKFICANYKGIDWDYDYPYQKAEALREADRILTLIKEAGYVKLAEAQTLPRNPHLGIPAFFMEWKEAQQDMLNAGWRKVELEMPDKPYHPESPAGRENWR